MIPESNPIAPWVQQLSHDHLLRLDEIEALYIIHVLAEVGGNKSRAARILGVNRSTLYRKLRQMTVDSSQEEAEPFAVRSHSVEPRLSAEGGGGFRGAHMEARDREP